jgi:diadenosine tetraphosphatase ApaH/serine/threonine PP2A family protein phosphatase
MDTNLFGSLTQIKNAKTRRASSWDTHGRNQDAWVIEGGETRVLADLKGPGCITHIWMTQGGEGVFRNVVLKMFWDNEKYPSVEVPLGDFFCLGHGISTSFQSLPFTSSVNERRENQFGPNAALNCNLQMPFDAAARIEVTNEGEGPYRQYFYVDYEVYDEPLREDTAYFHAQFRRENPCDGWGHEIRVNTPEANIVNVEKQAWDENYVILEAKGIGHYIGCNLSVTNFQGTWWGEGDDMIWVDGYKWPPDLHGTGSEDYLNQAWGMQDNAFLMNGSSIYEGNTGGYQTSYVFHLTNPVRFQKEIKVTIEHGHGNHLANEMASVAYWYQKEPHKRVSLPPVQKRQPVERLGERQVVSWDLPKPSRRKPSVNAEMKKMKKQWSQKRK